MAKYHKCTGCAVDKATCQNRAKIKEAIAGLGVTFIKFQCTDRKVSFVPGNRVEVTLPIYGEVDDWGQSDTDISTFHGTVVRETVRLGRYLVRLDLGENEDGYSIPGCLKKSDTGFVNVSLRFMKLNGEPDIYVCPNCGEVNGKHNGEFLHMCGAAQ